MFDESLVTVWSAPNYCYRCGNSASIMEVKEDGTTNFKVYMAAEENDRDPKNEAARRVSCGLAMAVPILSSNVFRSMFRVCLNTLCSLYRGAFVEWREAGLYLLTSSNCSQSARCINHSSNASRPESAR